MKHLKKFNKTFEGIRKEGEDVFIDGMSDENHILYPMIEELNNALRESNIEKMSDIISNVMNKCYDIQYQSRYRKDKRTLTKDELDQSKCLADSLSNILDSVEYFDDFDDEDFGDEDNGGDNFENENRREGLLDKDKLDAIIHDIVVNGKLWIPRQNNRNGW